MSTSAKKGTKPTRLDPIPVASASKSMHTCSDAKNFFSQWNTLLLWSTFILLILIALAITLWLCHATVQAGFTTIYAYQSMPYNDGFNASKEVPDYWRNLFILQCIWWTCLIVGNTYS